MGTFKSYPKYGLRIIRQARNSPAARSNLEPFFDFIVKAGTLEISQKADMQRFAELVEGSRNAPLRLTVFSTRKWSLRELVIVPTSWGGSGALGASVAFDDVTRAASQCVRVSEVKFRSPALEAGLEAFSDYIIGFPNGLFRNVADVNAYIEECRKQNVEENGEMMALEFLVYNVETEMTRNISIKLKRGELLGCVLAEGYLNRIPSAKEQESQQKVTRGAPSPTRSIISKVEESKKLEISNSLSNSEIFLGPRPGVIFTVKNEEEN
eukprot:GHVP01070871.1.p1 GENE.GHVP01070871.1~~GHVP01070871.1.p1  ORF type:complete len:267 (+),score=47.75 GHVP01070871.1:36-836(+)